MQTVPLSRCLKGSQIRLLEHKFSCYFQEKLWLTAENIDYFWLQLKKSIKFLKILKYLIQYLWRVTKGYKVATSDFSFSRIRLDSNAAVNKIFKTWLIPSKTSVVESNTNAWFHRGADIHRLGRRNLVASDSSSKVRRLSIPTTFVYSVLNSSSSTKRLYISTGDISTVVVVQWWSMAIKKKKLKKDFCHIILKRLKTKQKEI